MYFFLHLVWWDETWWNIVPKRLDSYAECFCGSHVLKALTARCWWLWCGWHFSIRCCSSLVEWWLIPVARPGQISNTLGYIEHIIENIRKLGWRLADSWLRLRVTSQLKLSADRLRGEHHLRSLAAWHGVGTSAVFVVRSCAFDWRHQTWFSNWL